MTSPLQRVDPATRSVMTRSGRVYRLGRGRGLSSDAEYVWRRWLELNEAKVLREATSSLLEQLAGAAPGSADPSGD
ncbi:MAG TPA: hypothetical protein PLS93_05145 [Accumulibacter sp.]|nr:hypothetical protein [Accumulibacter sp.]